MAQRVVVVALVVALSVGGWWLLRDDDAPARTAPEETTVSEEATPIGLGAPEMAPPLDAPTSSDAEPTALDVPAAPAAAAVDTVPDAPDDALPDFDPVPDARVAGHVLSTDGAPLPDARVLLFEHAWRDRDGRRSWGEDLVAETRADEQGAFAFDALPSDFFISAEHPEWACAERVEGEPSGPIDVEDAEILMAPALPASGSVRDAYGEPVEGARLTLSPAARNGPPEPRRIYAANVSSADPAALEVKSDASGAFAFAQVVAGTRDLKVEHGEHPTAQFQVQLDGSPIFVELDSGGSLLGVVYGADGEPLEGVEVFLRESSMGWQGGVESRDAVTDADGSFLMSGLSASGAAHLRLRAEGHAVHVVEQIGISGDDRVFLEIDLAPERVIAGRFVDPDGAPVPELSLRVEGERTIDFGGVSFARKPTWENWLSRSRTTSDSEGRFRFSQLYEGTFTLFAEDDTRKLGQWEIVAGDDELELVLDPEALGGVLVRGTVTDALDGLPILGASVIAYRWQGDTGIGGNSATSEPPLGAFEFRGLDPDVYSFSAKAPGYSSGRWTKQRYEEGEHEVSLQLSPHRELHLRVMRPDGSVVPGCSVSFHYALESREGWSLQVPSGGGSHSSVLTADADGLVHAYELPAEPIHVYVREDWNQDAIPFDFDLTTPQPELQTLVLDESLIPPPTERSVGVMLMAVKGELPDDLVGTSAEEFAPLQAELGARFAAGELTPLARSIAVTFTSAAGDVVQHASYGPGDDGDWVLTTEGSWSSMSMPGAFSWDVPVGGGTLTLDVEGEGTRTITLPGGDVEVQAALFFAAD